MLRNVFILFALVATVALPFALRPKDNQLAAADETLVIVTPHNEAIRYEFTRGFREWYKAKTGKTARIDWRIPGGTTEIARYLASEYEAPFEHYWKRTIHQAWTPTVRASYSDGKIKLGPDPARDTPEQQARRDFLASDVGIGIDLFFGGGSFDFAAQASAGRLVDSGFIKAHPELFGDGPEQIPQALGGETFWDKDGRWIGNVLSAFGICYNDDGLARLGITKPPTNWADLADPRYAGQLALADPNKSGSVAKAFEMIAQQQIQAKFPSELDHPMGITYSGPVTTMSSAPLGVQHPIVLSPDDIAHGTAHSQKLVADGWADAMRLILRMGANTRYFADAATRVPIDLGDGDGAVGMAIDFYGRFQAENTRDPKTGKERMHYFNPPGGTSIGVDPIGLLRGAPHRELALAFIDYVMSVEGQKLWNFKAGTPGGPEKYALRRLPVRRDLYAPEFKTFRSDPDVYPYEEAKNFTYRPEWTGALFNPLRLIVRVMCIDSHDEAREAWAALIAAKFPPQATAAFDDVSAVDYAAAGGPIADTLKAAEKDPLSAVRLTKTLSEHFRAQYRRAGELARTGK